MTGKRGDSMKKNQAAEHLTNNEYKLLMAIHSKHNASMGTGTKESYTASHITKVERNVKEKCFHVHYDNGDWFKYFSNGTWG